MAVGFSFRCLLMGHEDLIRRESDRMYLECCECSRTTCGWTVDRVNRWASRQIEEAHECTSAGGTAASPAMGQQRLTAHHAVLEPATASTPREEPARFAPSRLIRPKIDSHGERLRSLKSESPLTKVA